MRIECKLLGGVPHSDILEVRHSRTIVHDARIVASERLRMKSIYRLSIGHR